MRVKCLGCRAAVEDHDVACAVAALDDVAAVARIPDEGVGPVAAEEQVVARIVGYGVAAGRIAEAVVPFFAVNALIVVAARR